MKQLLYLILGATQALIIQDWIRVRSLHDTEHRALVEAYRLDEQSSRINGECVQTLWDCRKVVEAQIVHLDRLASDSEASHACRQVGTDTKVASAN